ncbi:MAG: carbamoyltransferase HypF [Clostridiaceae bacterium]|jgi:hydrogenase maturation protein HypF|nr:carbamoyltransferase HypF [Clostridiaceae bacterium]
MKNYEIRICGTVQGVGFRPFIHRLAHKHNLDGFVSNDGACVLIVIKANEKQLKDFVCDLKQKKPQSSDIVSLQVSERNCGDIDLFDKFKIKPSNNNTESPIFISPDFTVCENCMKELYEETNRRYLHPFISCMECGPRFSIMDCVPYDRENTTMSDFPMCSSCSEEYKSIKDRRYHAQTISCHKCGPQLKFRKVGSDKEIMGFGAFDQAVKLLKQGGIIAVKGVGGFHLCCSPFNSNSVARVRKLKGREGKPFAVMFDSVMEVEKYCFVSEKEKKQLLSRERPIVLLKRKESDLCEEVFKSSKYLGCFLPYTPLHKMMINTIGPLVMTSANISGEPIIIDNLKMMSLNDKLLSGILYNDRRILSGIDDSVVKVSSNNSVQFIRRARGFVPLPVYLGERFKEGRPVLACGSDLKNTFCVGQNGYAYLSQFGGDLEEARSFKVYKENLERFKRIFCIEPERVCCDLHPGYQTSKYARECGLEVLEVQHHHAHILSVMAENRLFHPVIGVAFDGTGYGTDGAMWGGEFLVASTDTFIRAGHLKYVPMLGGDSSVKEAYKTGYSYLYNSGLEMYIKDDRWQLIKAALKNNINTVRSSSMGRLFDAVSFLAGIKEYSTFEGECAILLENYAAEYGGVHSQQEGFMDYSSENIMDFYKPYNYEINEIDGKLIGDMNRCIREIITDSVNGVDKREIAWRFHVTIINYVLKTCTRIRELYKINDVALSGGVFQNSIIFEGAVKVLKCSGFNVFFNTKVPVNDGGVSLGQAFAGMF